MIIQTFSVNRDQMPQCEREAISSGVTFTLANQVEGSYINALVESIKREYPFAPTDELRRIAMSLKRLLGNPEDLLFPQDWLKELIWTMLDEVSFIILLHKERTGN